MQTDDILLRRLEQGAHARDDLAVMSCFYETELEALQNMSERLSLLEMQGLDSFEFQVQTGCGVGTFRARGMVPTSPA